MDSRQWVSENYPWDDELHVWHVKEVGDQQISVLPFIYTVAVIIGPTADRSGYRDRWCYSTHRGAFTAAKLWDLRYEDEPSGWHRHPLSGRRRIEGDSATEYVNP